ncbi:MAG: hypothetical protein JJ902_04050 [Roseibium sp.]|nr:hypothetical protein [Roseibium sp.]
MFNWEQGGAPFTREIARMGEAGLNRAYSDFMTPQATGPHSIGMDSSLGPDGTVSTSQTLSAEGTGVFNDQALGPGYQQSFVDRSKAAAEYERLLGQMRQNEQVQADAYRNMMGGGWTGGVLPANMADVFGSGGQFAPNPTSGIRPLNPFAQQSDISDRAPDGSSYGGFGEAQPIGGFGGPFTYQNPYI